MKHFYILLSICMIVSSCQPKSLPTSADIEEDRVIVKLSHETTRSELAEIYKNIKEKHDLDFNYTKSTFFEDGKLRILKLFVTLPSGKTGKTTADLMALQHNYYGMIWDTSSGKGTRFKIGALNGK